MLKIIRRPKSRLVIGPKDHGRRMSLDQFDTAVGQEGYLYELDKGVIDVIDIPHPNHLLQLQHVRDQLDLFSHANVGFIHAIAGSASAKVMLATDQSERHPDISVYLSAPPDTKDVWSVWVPDIVVEIVSRSSSKRDYRDKPAEYLALGIREYWIIDASKGLMTSLTRWRGQWRKTTYKANQKYKTPLLPGFVLDLKFVLTPVK